jgi:hypothetical protein
LSDRVCARRPSADPQDNQEHSRESETRSNTRDRLILSVHFGARLDKFALGGNPPGPYAPAMTKFDAKSLFLVTIALPSLCAGCSGRAPAENPPEARPAAQFGDEARQAARALSINQVRSVTAAADPYARMLLCKNGLDATAQRLQNSSVLTSQQRQVLQQAQAYLGRQLHRLGEEQGKSPTAIDSDLAQTAASHADAQENARIAAACLQGLQGAS